MITFHRQRTDDMEMELQVNITSFNFCDGTSPPPRSGYVK